MSNTLQQLGIDRLSSADRLELIGLIWDSLGPVDAADVPAWHQREVDRRRAAADANPEAGVPWEEAKARLMKDA